MASAPGMRACADSSSRSEARPRRRRASSSRRHPAKKARSITATGRWCVTRRRFCKAAKYDLVEEFRDAGVSGTKDLDRPPRPRGAPRPHREQRGEGGGCGTRGSPRARPHGLRGDPRPTRPSRREGDHSRRGRPIERRRRSDADVDPPGARRRRPVRQERDGPEAPRRPGTAAAEGTPGRGAQAVRLPARRDAWSSSTCGPCASPRRATELRGDCRQLNAEGHTTRYGKPWTRAAVFQVLSR